MLRILVLILILLPTISNADQGLKISCLNMKSILGKKYEPHPHFTYHTDIGMVPHMKEAKAWCIFYEPIDL